MITSPKNSPSRNPKATRRSVPAVGIDLVETARARDFYRRHRRRLNTLLSGAELAYLRPGRPGSAARLAEIFAAKEAVFKALGPRKSAAGFMQVRLSVRGGRLASRGVALKVERTPQFVVARCAGN